MYRGLRAEEAIPEAVLRVISLQLPVRHCTSISAGQVELTLVLQEAQQDGMEEVLEVPLTRTLVETEAGADLISDRGAPPYQTVSLLEAGAQVMAQGMVEMVGRLPGARVRAMVELLVQGAVVELRAREGLRGLGQTSTGLLDRWVKAGMEAPVMPQVATEAEEAEVDTTEEEAALQEREDQEQEAVAVVRILFQEVALAPEDTVQVMARSF